MDFGLAAKGVSDPWSFEGGVMSEQAPEQYRGFPVSTVDLRPDRPIFETYRELEAISQQGPIVWNTTGEGFWMLNSYDLVKEAFRMDDVFTNRKVNAFDPGMELRLLPNSLVGQEHKNWRALINPWFSPGGVRRMESVSRARCTTLIDELLPKGSCDFIAEFGILYPTEIFLTFVGLPVEDGPKFVAWNEAIFGGFFDVDQSAAAAAATAVAKYFEEVVADRQRSPRDPETDFATYLLQARIDGEPIAPEDVVTCCSTIMLAGLDTTRSALGFILQHLATHDEDRVRILDPVFADRAVDEFLRLYSLLIQDGRYIAQDVEFHGCPMKEGEMLSLGIISANRDPAKFEHADEFFPERGPNPHIAFGLGPHRCPGMHLARLEIAAAIEEWHLRIPNYRLANSDELIERGGQLSLRGLPLEWDVA